MNIDGKKILADLKDSVEIKVDLSGFAVKQIDAIIIPLVDSVLEKIKKAIPTEIDDALINANKDKIYAEVKQELTKILTKIEDKIEAAV